MSDINKEILIKLRENDSVGDNVKNFIHDALKLEYEEKDKSRPILKKKYLKLQRKNIMRTI